MSDGHHVLSLPTGKSTTCEQTKTNVKLYQANWVTKLHNNLRRKPWAADMQEMVKERIFSVACNCCFTMVSHVV